jgi:histidinol-phosphate/aromatic aminotransferase/cobyric acid decarboxylase-like protein
MTSKTALHLQYGVNAFADDVYQQYQPLKSTAHYPDPLASELRRAISRYTGFTEDMILCSSGSDELIDIYIRMHKAMLPGLKVAFSPPTYPQYEAYTAREEVNCIHLPHERATITAALVKKMGGNPKDTVVMLDSPANPSGEITSRDQFHDLLEAGYRVFADEAYHEFHGQTVADFIALYPKQLVVSRSLSKFAAMAGNRIGYLLAMPEVIQKFRAQQLFFNVNSEGQHRAQYALKHVELLHKAITEMRQTKQQVDTAIKQLGAYYVYPSLDMYAIFKHKTVPTEKLHQELLTKHNIHTTRFPHFKDQDVIRSAVLQLPLMQRLVTALGSYA